jgi:flagellar protein FliO/FliZ
MLQLLSKYTLYIGLLLLFCSNINAAEHLATSSEAINLSDYLKVILGLAFVVGLFLVSAFLFKRYGNTSMAGRGQIRLVDGLHLGNRERLVLVELKDKQILLSVTAGKISKLDTINIESTTESTNA